MGDVISSFLFQPPDEPTPISRSKVFWLETRLGSRIPAFFIKPFPGRFTILYSHGNAEDLGMLYEYLKELSRLLKVNIMAYDYTGYGLATIANEVEAWAFTASEEHCYADIEAAYHHLTDVEGVEPASIILYGRSVGSGPSCYLAEKMFIGIESEKRCGGLILHSPFLSVCRVVVDLGFTFSGDIFPNIDRVQHLGCPTFVIHGTEDAVVPFHHGKALYEALPKKYRAPPFWAKNLGHNDIELHQPRQFIKELRKYLALAANSPRTKRTIRFYDQDADRGESIFGPLRNPDGTPSIKSRRKKRTSSRRGVRQPEPVRYEGRSPSPTRERGGTPGILKTGSGSSYARDLREHDGSNGRYLPTPPPESSLLNVKVQKGSGRQGPVLGPLPSARSRSDNERKRSQIHLQQQMINSRAVSSSRSGSFGRR